MKKILFFMGILISGIHFSQTYYTQDFNTTGLNSWVSTDIDGDGKQWINSNLSSVNAGLGTGSLISRSWTSAGAITPNNLITSPLINLGLVTASNAYLQYDLATAPSYPAERYSIYVTTSNVSGTITSSTPVYTETVATGGFQSRSVNLTPFIGQEVYISFRHYECTDQNYLIVDNIQVKTLADKDIALKNIFLTEYGLISTDYQLKATVRNNGSEAVNNITLNWNDGATDHISTIPLSSPLNAGQEITVTHPAAINYSTVTEKNMAVTVTQINGTADTTPADNSKNTMFRTVSQNSPKKVLVEEGTGTWCGWCPRGAVAMKYMDTNYPDDFIGIAVHNSDPMAVSEYDTGSNFNGYPSMNVDRAALNKGVTNTEMTTQVTTRKTLITPAQLNASGGLTGNSLTLNTSATFRTMISNANFRFAVVLVEDGVKGTTTAYNQKNYYAGGNNGAMGGYETLPDPVPAAQMTYDHVGRMLLGGYTGQAGSVPTTITDGQVVNYLFTANIPTTYNLAKVKAVVLLLNGVTGEVINARSFLLGSLGTSTTETNSNYLTVYPNPTSEYIKVQANKNVDLKLYDVSGKVVLEKTNVAPDSPVSVEKLAKGVYIISITEKGSEPKTQKLIIK
ncbi:T9SS-dependent choice-of-anchor J family protein [Chryseobacterium herbae]|uniref:Omp28-related outer membrane protein n=1 Tax=Chryseobacterium herbae TaxID=2976476 RepID=A0ABT2IV33_9FLAO|nr:choice-of-anchor J domain-containing protein [Chryseobacterium sp. pc1-10]MCT2562703.1 Omp28-related outer membrane protein [Chryseobacterium sp. pc1-10]